MRRFIPDFDLNTTPAYREVSASDDLDYGWTITLSGVLVPASAVVTVLDYWADTDVSATIKSGGASVGSIVGSVCTVEQRLRGWTRGKLYLAKILVTTDSGLDEDHWSWFDCVG